jgi:hypothetical protein
MSRRIGKEQQNGKGLTFWGQMKFMCNDNIFGEHLNMKKENEVKTLLQATEEIYLDVDIGGIPYTDHVRKLKYTTFTIC